MYFFQNVMQNGKNNRLYRLYWKLLRMHTLINWGNVQSVNSNNNLFLFLNFFKQKKLDSKMKIQNYKYKLSKQLSFWQFCCCCSTFPTCHSLRSFFSWIEFLSLPCRIQFSCCPHFIQQKKLEFHNKKKFFNSKKILIESRACQLFKNNEKKCLEF